MEERHGSECSKTSPSNNEEDDECESKANNEEDHERKEKNNNNGGGSSSNSTVEENNNNSNEKKGSVRPYVRSKLPRLRWTPDLHLRFIHAVQRLGGQDRATPKLVLQLMNIKGLSIAHVKSHLQMFRSKKVDDPNQVLADHRNLVETGDRNMYNLSQLPMIIQGYHYPTSQTSANRYGYGDANASLGASEKMVHRPYIMGSWNNSIDESMKERIYRTNSDIINWNHNHNNNNSIFRVGSSNFVEQSSTSKTHEQKNEFLSFGAHGHETLCTRAQEHMPVNSTVNPQELKTLKRKASDADDHLDLDLSLKLNSRMINDNGEGRLLEKHEVVDSNLSLSLYSQSSSSTMKEAQQDGCNEQGKKACTLDLTI